MASVFEVKTNGYFRIQFKTNKLHTIQVGKLTKQQLITYRAKIDELEASVKHGLLPSVSCREWVDKLSTDLQNKLIKNGLVTWVRVEKNMKAIITVGVSGSGKTTWATKFCRENDFVNLNRDDLRFSLFGCSGWSEYKFSRGREQLITDVTDSMIETLANNGHNIVISNTNLNKRYRKQLIDELINLGYEVTIMDFPVEWDEVCRRDSVRQHGVGQEVLQRQWKEWQKYLESR